MLKKLLTAALITSMLVLPFANAALAVPEEDLPSAQEYCPGSVPAETDAETAMGPALHALVLAMLSRDADTFDPEDSGLAWEALYNMLSLYGQLDSRSISEQGELFFPEETARDYAAALDLDLDRLGAPPAEIRDRLNYDNASRCYVIVCGDDGLSSMELSSQEDGLSGSLVYAVDGTVLARFQARLQPCGSMFGYVITEASILG